MGGRHSLPKQEHARHCQVGAWVEGTHQWLARLERKGAPATLREEYSEAIGAWCDLKAEQRAWSKREGAVPRQACVDSGCCASVVGSLSRCVPCCLPAAAAAFEEGHQFPPEKPAPVPRPPWLGKACPPGRLLFWVPPRLPCCLAATEASGAILPFPRAAVSGSRLLQMLMAECVQLSPRTWPPTRCRRRC
jgi:hypothetical protein